jgi:hypothetical protein
MNFKTDYIYTDRETKAKFVFEKYKEILKGHILDVGADDLHLKQYLPEGSDYKGIGFGNHPELKVIDLEKEKIPFENNTFDCVLCLDVLEHLENIHEVFDELCRVSKKWIIISLPNPYNGIQNYFTKGNYMGRDKHIKFYGLPKEREADRHKWFFAASEARDFIQYKAEKNQLSIIDLFIEGEKSLGLPQGNDRKTKKSIKKIMEARQLLFIEGFNFSDLFQGTHWWVLKK